MREFQWKFVLTQPMKHVLAHQSSVCGKHCKLPTQQNPALPGHQGILASFRGATPPLQPQGLNPDWSNSKPIPVVCSFCR